MKVALVHDWLTGMRGGEFVLEALCEMFPDADLYTLVHIKGSVSQKIEDRKIYTSFLQYMPDVARRYRWFLPLMPRAIESFRLEGYDLVISSSHCVAKGVLTGDIPHICYCHTPMRYAWDMSHHYFNRARYSAPTLFAINQIMPRLQKWDKRVAGRVDVYIANSNYVKGRIEKIYGASARVVYPPVDLEYYTPGENDVKENYLMVSAFAPYKKVDIAIELFTERKMPLVIVGAGEDEQRLRDMAGPTIKFEGAVPRDRLRELYRNSKALIYPGEEDFGIIPVEAMACGTPVIAYGKGGALETVVPLRNAMTKNPTGVFFDVQEAVSLGGAIERFEASLGEFSPNSIRLQAEQFKKSVFLEKMWTVVREAVPTITWPIDI